MGVSASYLLLTKNQAAGYNYLPYSSWPQSHLRPHIRRLRSARSCVCIAPAHILGISFLCPHKISSMLSPEAGPILMREVRCDSEYIAPYSLVMCRRDVKSVTCLRP
jgi:hypothetical protein